MLGDYKLTPNRRYLNSTPVGTLEFDLLATQKQLFREFVERGFQDLFDEINPINDYSNTTWQISFEEFIWGQPKFSFSEAQNLGQSYEAPVYAIVKLVNKKTAEIKKQKIYLCDVPLMSERASFMYNGNERVVMLQILRSEGLLLGESKGSTPKHKLYSVKLMPHKGNWYEFEINKYGVMSIKLLQKRPRILLTTLLRAIGYSSDDEIRKALSDVDTGDISFVEATLEKDVTKNTEEALIDIYRKLRPEDAISVENAKNLIDLIFFNKRKFYLGKIGRYKLNKKMGISGDITPDDYLLKKKDIVSVIRMLIQLNNGQIPPDDIDSLQNRRIRGVNELLSEKMRAGVLALEKSIKDKMSTFSPDDKVTPAMFINTRPLSSAINQFFGSSALTRFMDQINILSELEVKRRVTAGGARGLTPERATFSVRDVHNSHYSKFCPITTPEGTSVGMVNQLAVYARVNEYGFLEAPYRQVISVFKVKEDDINDSDFQNRYLDNDIEGIAKKGEPLTSEIVKKCADKKIEEIYIQPFVSSKKVIYLDADDEINHKIANYDIKQDEYGNIIEDYVYVRDGQNYTKVKLHQIDCIDVSPAQIAGLGLALIPFAGNDDPNRTLVAAKTQTQSVPLIRPHQPIISSGFEQIAAKASGRTVYAEFDGVVDYADADQVSVTYDVDNQSVKRTYIAEKYKRTNQDTSFNQIVKVRTAQKFTKGSVLIDGPSTVDGDLSLGVNLRVAYVVYDGYNYEDGLVISERLVKEDVLTSVHINEYTQEIRETKLGNEEITRDIPNVGELQLKNLDEEGFVRIGAHVSSGDILVGIITPKGESELTAEEKLLRAIFGEYARDVKDNSLRMPNGEHGVVIGIQVIDKAQGGKLNPGVIKMVKVWVAKKHKISVGDKLTGYHGDKGIVTKVVPEYDMPYTEDGRPVDILLGPASMIRRMNLGQILETHISNIAIQKGEKLVVEPFSRYQVKSYIEEAKNMGINTDPKVTLYDPRTGEPYENKITVGYRYFFKLNHLADDKVHARSTGPYTLVTQQPVRGKAQKGGRRFGEMEVWALEAHGVPNLLHEMLTIKSDDVVGRAAAYKAIITNQKINPPKIPESFSVLEKELLGLGIKLTKIEPQVDDRFADISLEEIIDSIGNVDDREVVENSSFEIKNADEQSLESEEFCDLQIRDVNFE